MAYRAPIQSGTQRLGATTSPICGGGGIFRVKLRNSGPVAIVVGDSEITFEPHRGFELRPDDPWLELFTDDLIYGIGPPNAAGIGQARIDYITETR